jgi:hypothetical protein
VRTLVSPVDESGNTGGVGRFRQSVCLHEPLAVVLAENRTEGLREMVVRRVRRVVFEVLLDSVTEGVELRPRRDWVGRSRCREILVGHVSAWPFA